MRLSKFRRPLLSLCAALILPTAACGDDSTPGPDTTDTTQPDTDTAQPDTDTAQPDTDTAQPDTDTAQPDTDTVQPDTDTEQPDTDTEQPDTDTEQPDTDTEQPDTDTEQPDTDDTEQPDTDTEQPDTDTEQPTTATLAELLTPFADSANNFETAPNAKVTGLVVTLVKPDVGTELGGFFVQDPADQKAIYFAPATGVAALPEALEETSVIEVTIGKIKNVSGMPMVTEYSDLTITGVVESLDEAFQDATDWEVADWAGKQSTYIDMAGMIVGDSTAAGGSVAGAGGYHRFAFISNGIEAATTDINIRFPVELINYFGIENGCEFELIAGSVWAYRGNSPTDTIQYQPMFFAPWSFTFLLCTPPVISNVVTTNNTTVVLTFSRPMLEESIDLTSFTFDPPLAVLAVDVSDDLKKVTLTTAEHIAASYTVTVATDVFDTTIEPLPADQRSFTFATGEVAPTVIAGWNFGPSTDSFTLVATSGIAANSNKVVSSTADGEIAPIAGNTNEGTAATLGNQSPRTSWANGEGTKAWVVEFTTLGHTDLRVAKWVQRSSNTGPRDFRIEYSLNGSTWTAVTDSNVVLANAYSTHGPLSLPSEVANQATVYLRWVMSSNTAVNGSAVAIAGTSRIDEIIIDGVPAP